MIDLDIIQGIEDYLERPVIVSSPRYFEVCDPATGELLATVEKIGPFYELRIEGEIKTKLEKQ